MAIEKLKTLSELLRIVQSARRRGSRIVFTNGCFDLLHVGHARLLEKARRLGDLLVVGLNSNASVRKLKGPRRPINSERARAELLSALKAVDFVVVFSDETPERIIRKIRPHVLVKGGDWEKSGVVGREFVESYQGKVYLYPLVKGYSTTRLLHERQGIRQRESLRRHRSPGPKREKPSPRSGPRGPRGRSGRSAPGQSRIG